MAWKSWKDVPVGEQNYLSTLADVWEQTIGFQVTLSSADLLALANAGVQTQHDMGQFVKSHWGDRFGNVLNSMPWASYGLDKDTYSAMSGTFETEYKKITGSDITKEALDQAFQNPRDATGGLLTASQYAQQLMNDANIQKAFGWVKYGMDFSQWTQQKLQLQTSFGRSVKDAEAATILQYNKQAAGANESAIARSAGNQQREPAGAGVTQSVVR